MRLDSAQGTRRYEKDSLSVQRDISGNSILYNSPFLKPYFCKMYMYLCHHFSERQRKTKGQTPVHLPYIFACNKEICESQDLFCPATATHKNSPIRLNCKARPPAWSIRE